MEGMWVVGPCIKPSEAGRHFASLCFSGQGVHMQASLFKTFVRFTWRCHMGGTQKVIGEVGEVRAGRRLVRIMPTLYMIITYILRTRVLY